MPDARCVWADAASLASRAMPGGPYSETRNVAAATCEADAPCSVNTVLFSLSSLTLSQHDTPLVFLEMFVSLECLRCQRSMGDAK